MMPYRLTNTVLNNHLTNNAECVTVVAAHKKERDEMDDKDLMWRVQCEYNADYGMLYTLPDEDGVARDIMSVPSHFEAEDGERFFVDVRRVAGAKHNSI